MGVLNGYLFYGIPQRKNNNRNGTYIYGPFCCTLLASMLIMAEPTRHVLQDGTFRVGDLYALGCTLLALLWSITIYTTYTQRPFGLVAAGRRETCGRHMARISVTYLLLSAAAGVVLVGHSTLGNHWSGSSVLEWQECGNNVNYPRINETWSDACFWSSSQFHCTLPCCVPNSNVTASLNTTTDCTCECIPTKEEGMSHLSAMGQLFTLGFTYSGFALLTTGTLWNASLLAKLARKWSALRVRAGR